MMMNHVYMRNKTCKFIHGTCQQKLWRLKVRMSSDLLRDFFKMIIEVYFQIVYERSQTRTHTQATHANANRRRNRFEGWGTFCARPSPCMFHLWTFWQRRPTILGTIFNCLRRTCCFFQVVRYTFTAAAVSSQYSSTPRDSLTISLLLSLRRRLFVKVDWQRILFFSCAPSNYTVRDTSGIPDE